MNWLTYTYYVLMVFCFVASLFYLNNQKVRLLATLLFFSIVTETIVEIIGKDKNQHFIVYHFFILTEYSLITLILKQSNLNKKIQDLMLLSIPVFCILSVYLSFFV